MTIEEKIEEKIKKEKNYNGLTQDDILELMKGLSLNRPVATTNYMCYVGRNFIDKFNEVIKNEVSRAKGSRKDRKRKDRKRKRKRF